MRLVFHIKILFVSFMLIQCFSAKSYKDSTVYKIESKYKTEYSAYFKFNTFNRGADYDLLASKLDSLSAKNKRLWTRDDSILFAKTNLLAGNTKLAEHYFSNIKIDPKKNLDDNLYDLMSIYIAKDFDKGNRKIKRNYPRIIQHSQIYFLKQIFAAQDSLLNIEGWYKSNPQVLHFNFDTNLTRYSKNTKRYKDEIIAPLIRARKILELIVLHVHEDDIVLAKAFNDIGVVLEKHVSLSQAYIAYNIGRNYNKRDKVILQNIKDVKAKLLLKNYKIPNFRKYFPRIKEWRFDYEMLKEKIIQERNDTIPKHSPILRTKKVKTNFPFPPEIIIPAGFLFLFLFIILFLRTRKK